MCTRDVSPKRRIILAYSAGLTVPLATGLLAASGVFALDSVGVVHEAVVPGASEVGAELDYRKVVVRRENTRRMSDVEYTMPSLHLEED